jgi:hypothetical protein
MLARHWVKWGMLVNMLLDVQGFVHEVEFFESGVKKICKKEVKQMQVRNI